MKKKGLVNKNSRFLYIKYKSHYYIQYKFEADSYNQVELL